eukprot:1220625-Prymnesium_polylepis.2
MAGIRGLRCSGVRRREQTCRRAVVAHRAGNCRQLLCVGGQDRPRTQHELRPRRPPRHTASRCLWARSALRSPHSDRAQRSQPRPTK